MIRRAVGADSEVLCSLLRRCPQSSGRAALVTDRAPDFFRRAHPFTESWVLAVEGASGALDATVTIAMKNVSIAGQQIVAGYVFDLAVDPAGRGRGMASRLLREVEDLAVAAGADVLYAHVMAGNVASSATFARAGYEQRAAIVVRVVPVESAPEARTDACGGGEDVGKVPSPVSDWGAAAAVIAGAESGHDLTRGHDGASLRREWTGLHGWRADDVWHESGAVLGLWDYAAVARFMPIASGSPSSKRSGDRMCAGLVLGGAGDEESLGYMFSTALERAGMRGMDALFTGHDDRVEPRWLGDHDAIAEPYYLLAKALRPGVAERLGERPVQVDPIDL